MRIRVETAQPLCRFPGWRAASIWFFIKVRWVIRSCYRQSLSYQENHTLTNKEDGFKGQRVLTSISFPIQSQKTSDPLCLWTPLSLTHTNTYNYRDSALYMPTEDRKQLERQRWIHLEKCMCLSTSNPLSASCWFCLWNLSFQFMGSQKCIILGGSYSLQGVSSFAEVALICVSPGLSSTVLLMEHALSDPTRFRKVS